MKCSVYISCHFYATFNNEIPETDWLSLKFDQIITSSQGVFLTSKTDNYNVGQNMSSNKSHTLNGTIKNDWLNIPISSFKIL
jgi:hypothetical protein